MMPRRRRKYKISACSKSEKDNPIEPSNRCLADLVVLNRNPLDDIHNTNTIQYVI